MSWIFIILFLSFGFSSLSEAGHHKNHPSAVVVGTVYCDTCFQQDVSRDSHFIPGASVLVQCKDGNLKESFRKEVKTDEHGEFQVDLPFTVSRYVKRIKRCSVKLINSSEPYCAVASSATSSSLHLKSRKEGIHIFSAGFFTFKPLKQPTLCSRKPIVHDSRVINNRKTGFGSGDTITVPPPIKDPKVPKFPQLHFLPALPPLPQLPNLPSLPPHPGLPTLPPLPGKGSPLTKRNIAHPAYFFPPPNLLDPPPPQLLPPTPFQPTAPPLPPSSRRPPPAPLNPSPPIPGPTPPPTPFRPPAPSLPPFSRQPPPASLNPSPSIPRLTPSPSPPPSPSLPIPPPPFPLPQPPFVSFPTSSTP
ncbi:hypothetical protein SLEP1_g27513 [Rubroshorea leprosula]|uniref:Pollen Ole e 1 allergen and extensin family protein n=1 Tax=Rubroshorea leprosula TaxID=152421 RepID=A0AAV5JWQ7_9ROSI|nr:hypothetical protein SLEP1_g27513 [Rubroshorea leprosula]